MTDATL